MLFVTPSLPLVLSLHRHVSSVLTLHCLKIHTHIIHLHACTTIHLGAPCMACMLHDLFSQSRCKSRISQNSLTHNSHRTIARSLHAVHVVRCVQNSMNSLGDGVVRGRSVCVPRGTKSLSTSTRTGVRRSAVYESAPTQQAPLKLHEETWVGLLCNQENFKEVEIVPGCVVKVACPSCPDLSSEPPGPDRVIRNMIGLSLQEQTDRSGVWLFRGALQGENIFSP